MIFFFWEDWLEIEKLRDDKKMNRCFEFKIRDFFEEEEVVVENEKDYWFVFALTLVFSANYSKVTQRNCVKKEQIPLEIYI